MLELVSHYSVFGLFAIIFIEEAGIPLPIPGDIFIGATSALPNSNYFEIVASVMIATLVGSTILFWISRKIGHYLITRFGKYIKIDEVKVKKIGKWFEKRGGFAIIIGRLVPGLRTITPIVAGTFDVSYKTFWIYTAIAAFIWANVYFFIGKFFGSLIQSFVH